MSEQQFDIIFRGDIVLGHNLAEVKVRLQQLFKADAARIDALFSGRPVPLKKGLDATNAQKYKEILLKAGVQVSVVAVVSADVAAVTEKPVVAATAPPVSQSVPAPEAAPTVTGGQWSLAPAGAEILKPGERQHLETVSVDISGISLRPEGGNLIDAGERAPAAVAAVVVPAFEVAPIGSDLSPEGSYPALPEVEVMLEDWSLAEAGADLLSEDERPIIPVAPIHIPEVKLAPVGSDLGQLKSRVAPVAPDISYIKLQD